MPVEALTVAALRATVLVTPHEPHLFAGSVLDNVLMDEVDGHDQPQAVAGARSALTAAACDDVVAVLPHGLATPVGEAGSRLSGGQRQRVGLARVLHAAPEVLVLQDPTTGVDSVTEQRVAAATSALRRGRTTVVIAASPAWIAQADRVVPWVGR